MHLISHHKHSYCTHHQSNFKVLSRHNEDCHEDRYCMYCEEAHLRHELYQKPDRSAFVFCFSRFFGRVYLSIIPVPPFFTLHQITTLAFHFKDRRLSILTSDSSDEDEEGIAKPSALGKPSLSIPNSKSRDSF